MATILQVNTNTSTAATLLMEKTCRDKNIKLAIIQEPNKKTARNKGGYLLSTDERVAIFVPRGSNTAIDKWGKGNGYVWMSTTSATFISCYVSPNSTMQEYERYLDDLKQEVRRHTNVVIGGDFNAKSYLWESSVSDRRGEALSDTISELNLVVINRGRTPTLQRPNGCSIIDVTLASTRIADKIRSWSVEEEEENLSDHNNIYFKVTDGITKAQPLFPSTRKWRITEEGMQRIGELATQDKLQYGTQREELLTTTIQGMCAKAFEKLKIRKHGRQPVHWWCEDVSNAWKQCKAARRALQRQNRRGPDEAVAKQRAAEEYKHHRKNLRARIAQARTRAWNKLLEEIDTDMWGLGCKIAAGKLAKRRTTIPPEETLRQAQALFPNAPLLVWEDVTTDDTNIEVFTDDEVMEAANKAKAKKAPGLDGIPAEVVSKIANSNAGLLTKEINRLWGKGDFPRSWKKARLTLVEKQNSTPKTEKKYRPICLLSSIGKLYERLIKKRLEEELESGENLYEHQYGFRANRSTVDAVLQVLSHVETVNKTSYVCRKFCLLIALDIKNAFNSLRWDVIINEIKKRKMSSRLLKTIQNYLKDRTIQTEDGTLLRATCGVPQGSVLGPTLWNIAYDSVLRQEMPPGTHLVAFADDLAVVIVGRSEDQIRAHAVAAVRQLTTSLHDMGLELASHKTEMVLLAGRQKLMEINIKLDTNEELQSKKSIKYLGVHLDKDCRMSQHVIETVKKAERQVAALARLMPNIKGPRQAIRRIYAGAKGDTWKEGNFWKIRKIKVTINEEEKKKKTDVIPKPTTGMTDNHGDNSYWV